MPLRCLAPSPGTSFSLAVGGCLDLNLLFVNVSGVSCLGWVAYPWPCLVVSAAVPRGAVG